MVEERGPSPGERWLRILQRTCPLSSSRHLGICPSLYPYTYPHPDLLCHPYPFHCRDLDICPHFAWHRTPLHRHNALTVFRQVAVNHYRCHRHGTVRTYVKERGSCCGSCETICVVPATASGGASGPFWA